MNGRCDSSANGRCDSTASGNRTSPGSARPTSTDARPTGAGPALRPAPGEPNSRSSRAFLRWIESGGAATPTGATSRRSSPATSDREESRAGVTVRRTPSGGRVARTWGELLITASTMVDGSRTYELRNEADRDANPAALDRLDRLRDLRDRIRFDDEGEFRPLRSAPTLPTGWYCPGLDGATLARAVETVYPATITDWARECEGSLDVTHFRVTADRQTGIYDRVAALDRSALDAVVRTCCVDDACLKRRRWEYDDKESVDVPRGNGTFPCREPCSMVLERARESVVDGSSDRGVDR
ncbi:DR2241 family protein [Halovivax cerinus]|uniref:DR2241 family protein n=1 Tax=Halovivax cerinus TaxID=1487865 RepID=A0ABD5NT94_9EURY